MLRYILTIELYKVISFGLRSKQHFATVATYAKDPIVLRFHIDNFL